MFKYGALNNKRQSIAHKNGMYGSRVCVYKLRNAYMFKLNAFYIHVHVYVAHTFHKYFHFFLKNHPIEEFAAHSFETETEIATLKSYTMNS